MSVLVYLIPLALVFGLGGLGAFIWALRSGQYDDLDGAGERVLLDDEDVGGRFTSSLRGGAADEATQGYGE